MSRSNTAAASCRPMACKMSNNSVTDASSQLVLASHKSNSASVGLGLDAKKLSCLKDYNNVSMINSV